MKIDFAPIGRAVLVVCLVFGVDNSATLARSWSDPSGKFKFEGTLVSVHEGIVVLQGDKTGLIAVRIDELSTEDQTYVKSKEAKSSLEKNAKTQSGTKWKLTNGETMIGTVSDIAIQNLTIHRKDDMLYVGDTSQEKLRPIYRDMVVAIVNQYGGTNFKTLREVEEHLKKLRPPMLEYQVESVVISSDELGAVYVPFFLFDERSKKLLGPSIDRLKQIASAKIDDSERNSLSSQESAMSSALLRANAMSMQEELLSMRMLQLGSLVGSQALDVWDVQLIPTIPYRWPVTAVVVADNSAIAATMAVKRYPGYTVGGIARSY